MSAPQMPPSAGGAGQQGVAGQFPPPSAFGAPAGYGPGQQQWTGMPAADGQQYPGNPPYAGAQQYGAAVGQPSGQPGAWGPGPQGQWPGAGQQQPGAWGPGSGQPPGLAAPQAPAPVRVVRRPARRVRIGLIQGGCALAGLLLAFLASKLGWEPLFAREAAIPVMVTVAFSVVGLVTILFSLMFTVVQWVYGTFSLRRRQLEDRPLPWWLFGLTIGIFVYSMAALVLTTQDQQVSWIVPGLTFLGTLGALILMRQLQISAFTSVQLGATLQSLTAEGLAVVDAVYPAQIGEVPRPQAPMLSGEPAVVTWQLGPARVQQLDEAALVEIAAASGSFVSVAVAVGDLITQGQPVARVFGPVGPGLERVFITGAERTPAQDPLLPVRVISDVALRALSPAVNDPATAVAAMDSLGPVLNRLAAKDLDTGLLTDPAGRVVAEIPVPSWGDFLAESLDDLVVCAAALPSAARRLDSLLATLADVAPADRKAPVEERRSALAARITG